MHTAKKALHKGIIQQIAVSQFPQDLTTTDIITDKMRITGQ